MKKHKIDNLFKKNLQGGNLPYSEDFWAGAEKLIATPKPMPAAKPAIAFSYRAAAWALGIAMAGTAGYFWLAPAAEKETLAQPKAAQQSEAPLVDTEKTRNKNAEEIAVPAAETENTSGALAGPPKPSVQPNERNANRHAEAGPQMRVWSKENNGKAKTAKTGTKKAGTTTNVNSSYPDVATVNVYASKDYSAKKTPHANAKSQNAEHLSNPPNANTHWNVIECYAREQLKPNPLPEARPIILPHQKNKNVLFSAGIEYQYMLLHRSLTTQTTELQNYVNFRNAYENPQNQTSFGVSVQAEANQWLFNTGIYHTTFTEEIGYPTTLLVDVGVDNGQWQVNDNWNYTTDSTWVIDSIYTGHWRIDTAWTLTQDSLWLSQWDTVSTEKEMPELAANNGPHSLSYLEIPLWFGRSFGKNRVHIDVQGGVGFGIFTGTSGSYYINQKVDGLVTYSYQVAQFRTYNLSGMVRAGMRYEISPQIQATFYPMLRYTFSNILTDDAVRQRYLGYGISVGLLYRF